MKIRVKKFEGGVLIPADDREAERLKRFKNGEEYDIEIKLSRNPQFHRKVFAFFNFCFEYWTPPESENRDEIAQFDRFRRDLTILAGYYKEVYNIRGELRVEAESLSYGNMEQEEYERFYVALTNAAMRTIFKDSPPEVYDKLLSFF